MFERQACLDSVLQPKEAGRFRAAFKVCYDVTGAGKRAVSVSGRPGDREAAKHKGRRSDGSVPCNGTFKAK